MSNPFEDPDADYLVLVNAAGQRSLWPATVAVPVGWSLEHGPDDRPGCIAFIDTHWTDIRPQGDRACPFRFPFRDYSALDLDPLYEALRTQTGMARVHPPHGDDAWLAVSYEQVKQVMTDPRFSRQVDGCDEARLTPLPIRTSILGMDPPDHTRLRKALYAVLTPDHAKSIAPMCAAIGDELIDAMVAAGSSAELVRDFALPFTGKISCHLLDVPAADRTRFKTWIDGFSSTCALPEAEVELRMNAMYAYITSLVRDRRRTPGDDVISRLLHPADPALTLSEQELVELVTVLLLAGYDSTALELANAIFVLLAHPQQLELLRARPKLMPRAIKELLRYIPLDSHVTFARYAREDVQVGSTLVRAGDAVLASFPSANRDSSVFDDPERFDISKDRKPHLGLGWGLHRCAGVPLAMVELEVALGALIDRLPELRLAVTPGEVQWTAGTLLRSPVELPVTWRS